MIPNHHRTAVVEPSHQADGELAEGHRNHRDAGHDIVCYIAVTAETRTSVAELVPTVAKLAPTVVDATERCCVCRIAGLLAEGGGGRSDALIHGTCPLAAGLHSADSHDGRECAPIPLPAEVTSTILCPRRAR
jgi:hypothetical protein